MMVQGGNLLELEFTNHELELFQQRSGVRVKNLVGYDNIDQRLQLFRQLFQQRSPQPDICKIDTIWPGALADDLLDLRPYLHEELEAIEPDLLRYFTVKGRLVGLPYVVDTAVLYYRTDLLRKYGYRHPPKTWDELGRMAAVIQRGERRAGNKDFWGYLWQGDQSESLTCDALEWQMAEGGGNLFEANGAVNVANRACRRAIERAASWVGAISPTSVVEYDEDDAQYLWQAGNTAFMRGWLDVYQASRQPSSRIRDKFDVAALPAGSKTRSWTFGGMAFAVSRYSCHPVEAVEAVRFLVSAEVQRRRARIVGLVPGRTALLEDRSLLADTAFHGVFGKCWREGMFARPSSLTGNRYDLVSRAYAGAVHKVLTHRTTAASALDELQSELVHLTGFRAVSSAVGP